MNDLFLFLLAAAPTSQPAGPRPWWAGLFDSMMFPMIAILAIFYFIMIKSKRKQDKSRQDLLGNLKRGDRIRTIGGILGTVVEARDDEVVVKVDESSNTKIRFARSAIHTVEVDKNASGKDSAVSSK